MKRFCIKVAIWVAVLAAALLLFLGLKWGRIIEGTLFAEIAKWVGMGFVVIGILEGFVYFLAPLAWHRKQMRKNRDA